MDMEKSVMIAIASVVVMAVVVNDKIDSTGSAWSPTGADLLKDLLCLALGAIIIIIITILIIVVGKWLSYRRDLGSGGV